MQAYPRAIQPHACLAGQISQLRGNYERSLEEAKSALILDPDFPFEYSTLASSSIALGRMDDAENALRRASERKLDIPEFFLERYMIAFLKGDIAGMERVAMQAQGKPEVEEWMSNAEGFVLAYTGHLEEARKMSRQAADLTHEADQKETEALYEKDAALREALLGKASTARQRARASIDLSNSLDVEYGAAFAFAYTGDSSRSQTLTDDLARRFAEDTKARFIYAPTLRALLALDHKEPSKAIELLQVTIPFEDGTLSSGGSEILLGAGNFYLAYVRGEAYLAMHRGREAANEFQKILEHRGVVRSDPVGALAHLQLGRAYVLAGDKDEARTAYKDFLTLWKDADSDIAILKEARAEYAELQ
jgi:tetratricopeptide (TPR) repeat protein